MRKEEDLELDDDDINIIKKRKIASRDFLKMTEKKFMQDGLKRGPTSRLADFAKELGKRKLKAFSSYKSLREVLIRYGLESEGTDKIPLFSLQTYEIKDSDKHFEHHNSLALSRPRSRRYWPDGARSHGSCSTCPCSTGRSCTRTPPCPREIPVGWWQCRRPGWC